MAEMMDGEHGSRAARLAARKAIRLASRQVEETNQERSQRLWQENYNRVTSVECLSEVSTLDIERACGFAAWMARKECLKGWSGRPVNQGLVGALRHEIEVLKHELRLRAERLGVQ